MACAGHKADDEPESCGGVWANQVYRVSEYNLKSDCATVDLVSLWRGEDI